MVCTDGIDGSICDLMSEAGRSLGVFFGHVAPSFLILAIIIGTTIVLIATFILINGFIKKAGRT